MFDRVSRTNVEPKEDDQKLVANVLGLCFMMFLFGYMSFKELKYLMFSTRTSGTILSVSLKEVDSNDPRPKKLEYSFVDVSGHQRQGRGAADRDSDFKIGQRIDVQYFPTKDGSERIVGLAPLVPVYLFLAGCVYCCWYLWKLAREASRPFPPRPRRQLL
jgi:hypothetical protein